MDVSNSIKINSKYKFKYLGMKWRFLKVDLEKECLPVIENNENKNEILQNQLILERSVILDSYEKGLNLSCCHQNKNEGENTVNNNYMNNGLSLYEDSLNSLQQYTTTISDIDSVFTEDDIIRGIRNMQIFKSIEPIKPSPPTTARQQTGPSKAMVFSPRPPDGLKPSNTIVISQSSIINTTGKYNSPRHFRKLKPKKGIPLKDQIQKLDISKNFKMYAIEKGIRIPECVKSVPIDNFEGIIPNKQLPQSISKDGQFPQKSISSIDLRKPIKP